MKRINVTPREVPRHPLEQFGNALSDLDAAIRKPVRVIWIEEFHGRFGKETRRREAVLVCVAPETRDATIEVNHRRRVVPLASLCVEERHRGRLLEFLQEQLGA